MRILTVRVALPHEPKPVIEGLNCEFAPQSELNGIVMLSTGSSKPKSSSVTSTNNSSGTCLCVYDMQVNHASSHAVYIARPRMPRRRSVHACARTMHQVRTAR